VKLFLVSQNVHCDTEVEKEIFVQPYAKQAAKSNFATVAFNYWRLDFSGMKLETTEFIIPTF
jgi:hypothetical protein